MVLGSVVESFFQVTVKAVNEAKIDTIISFYHFTFNI